MKLIEIDRVPSPAETLGQFNTNVFGPMNINPHMRERKTGTIIWVGSAAVDTLPSVIMPPRRPPLVDCPRVCIEPGYFRTDFLNPYRTGSDVTHIKTYREVNKASEEMFSAVNGNQPGDPELTVNAVIDIVKGEGLAKGKAFPTVVSLGGSGYDIVGGACTGLVGLETWKDLTSSVDFPQGA
ncbi:unnamed protein product [Somion occarium]|uniref:Uncharacterized protein n=1 Tax=Somion occarium TaxID=3059160 RepID=A0ABP1CVM5_9APHY